MGKKYKYETHLHTQEGSACARSSGADYIEPYIQIGYSGLFVTDHFWGGNTAVDRSLPWNIWVENFCKGYEAAFSAAEEYNIKNNLKGTEKEFKVFFGFEQSFQGDDYLIYGLSKQWLLENPQVANMTHRELFEAVNKQKGVMIQAHPFRFRQYMQAMHQHPLEVHGIEVYNGGNKPIENQMAELYAQAFDFPVTSGSDIHGTETVFKKEGMPIGGVCFDEPLKSIEDYVNRIKNRKGIIIK